MRTGDETGLFGSHVSGCLGRDGPFEPPPEQNPASGFPAPGSHLGSTGSEAFVGPRVKNARWRKREPCLERLSLRLRPSTALASSL